VSVSAPQNGVEFQIMPNPQPTEPGKRVEVIEFFAYFCPFCNALDPVLADWVKKNADKVNFKRVHVDYHHDRTVAQQRLFATLDAMGKLEEDHAKVFHAIHVDHKQLADDAEVIAFATSKEGLGLDKQEFTKTFHSFTTDAKLSRNLQMASAYGINSLPSLVVDGHILTSPAMAIAGVGHSVSNRDMNLAGLQVLDVLVAKQQQERAGGAALSSK
jgi:thiol:disulfide interchange protein DsbA